MNLSGGHLQVILVGIICLSGPGLFNGLTGLGGAGNDDTVVASQANALLYITFGTLGFFGGALFNILGNRLMFFIGGIGYAAYGLTQYLAMTNDSLNSLAIAAGGVLGISAACLWTAQGACTLAYAPPGKEAKYISTFWLIFSIGGFLGGTLMLIGNWNNSGEAAEKANAASYYIMLAFMLVGPLVSITLIRPPDKVIKENGEMAAISKGRTVGQELAAVLGGMLDSKMHLMAPFFFLSLMWFPYIFNGINEVVFNIRSRGFNSALFWLVQMGGSKLALWILDSRSRSRQSQGMKFFWILAVYSNIAFLVGAYVQYLIEFGSLAEAAAGAKVDFLDWRKGSIPIISLILFSIMDSLVQSYCMWMNSGLADNDNDKMARYSGFFKSVQSIGAALSWQIGAKEYSFRFQLGLCWAMLLFSLPTTLIANFSLSKHIPESYSRQSSREVSIVFRDQLTKSHVDSYISNDKPFKKRVMNKLYAVSIANDVIDRAFEIDHGSKKVMKIGNVDRVSHS